MGLWEGSQKCLPHKNLKMLTKGPYEMLTKEQENAHKRVLKNGKKSFETDGKRDLKMITIELWKW